MKRLLTALVLALTLIGGANALAVTPVDNTSPVKLSGCAVRLQTTPYLHQNAAHSCAGFTSAEYDDQGRLVVRFNGSGCVRSVSLSPDETLVRRGIAAGGSGGSSQLTIFFAHNGKFISADDPYLHGALSNLWIIVINEIGPVCTGLGKK